MPLARGGLDVMLRQALDGAAVRQHMIGEALAEPVTYWELAAAQRQALAESVTLPTTTAFGRAASAGIIAEVPGMGEELRAARYLELGCGGGRGIHRHPGMRGELLRHPARPSSLNGEPRGPGQPGPPVSRRLTGRRSGRGARR